VGDVQATERHTNRFQTRESKTKKSKDFTGLHNKNISSQIKEQMK
jgi:hypothetical protein